MPCIPNGSGVSSLQVLDTRCSGAAVLVVAEQHMMVSQAFQVHLPHRLPHLPGLYTATFTYTPSFGIPVLR